MLLQECLALAGFAFAASITPGPNNLMLLSSATNFGWRRSLPHLFGVAFGFLFMLLLVGLGIGEVFNRWPAIELWLRGLCLAYLAYLALRLALTPVGTGPALEAETGRPLSFLQAAAFQWVNPKAWTMALAAMSIYLPDESTWSVLLVAGVFGLVNLPCISSWTLLGLKLREVLGTPQRLRTFNVAMAVLLVASVLPLALPSA